MDPLFKWAPSYYWTETGSAKAAVDGWYVSFDLGSLGALEKGRKLNIRCVRGEAPWPFDPSDRLEADTEQIVKDTHFGYLWQKADDGTPRKGKDAAAYCESLELDGVTGWRLPTVAELLTLVDYNNFKPASSTEIIAAEPVYYWTGSAAARSPKFSWFVHFSLGASSTARRTEAYAVRCVKDAN